MSKMRCQHYRETAFWGLRVSASCCLLVSDHSAFATPSGLNHLPAADTVSDRTVAVQACDTFGSDGQDYWTGFKTGLDFRPFKGGGGRVPLFSERTSKRWQNPHAFAV